MRKSTASCLAASFCLLGSTTNAFQLPPHSHPRHRCKQSRLSRRMKTPSSSSTDRDERSRVRFEESSPQLHFFVNDGRTRKTALSVATLADGVERSATSWIRMLSPSNRIIERGDHDIMNTSTKVLSASLLVTSNTVGPSMFTLPEAVDGVGMMWGTAIFVVLYMYNLISGLLLADVAIKIHESSECEVPSSFKDFVDTATQSDTAGTLTAGASLLSNTCFLAYGIVHAGSLLRPCLQDIGLDPIVGVGAFATMIAFFSFTCNYTGLEKIANSAVMVVFCSFATLLIPSMSNVSDPIGTLLAPGTFSDQLGAAVATAVPLLLSSLVYQNIVPSITKLLDFDRTNTSIAIAVGSFLPMAMYWCWCFASLGGGLESATSSSAGAIAFTAFSASALVGSCITAVMSLAEEFESIISRNMINEKGDEPCPIRNRFSTPAVAAAMAPAVIAAFAYSNGGDLTGALHFNGAFITPFLYGLMPIILYNSVGNRNKTSERPWSYWNLPIMLLGAGTIGTVGHDIIQDIPGLQNLLA